MVGTLRAVAALLLTTAFFLSGNGLQGTLVPVRADLEGFSQITIGLMGSAYFVGFGFGCLFAPHILMRVGHIRTFAAFGAVTAIALLLHPLLVSPAAWLLLRALVGAAAAAQYMVLDSWFHDQATNETRGRLLATYSVVNLCALVFGQFLFAIGSPDGNARFAFVAILILLSLLPVILTLLPQPSAMRRPSLRLGMLYRASPVGFMGNVVVGLTGGAFWTLGPLFASQTLGGREEIAIFMGTVIAGAAIAQWPLGWLSDRMDRRVVIGFSGLAAVGAGLLLALGAAIGEGGLWLIYPGALVFGAFAFPIGALSSAHLNDHVQRDELTEVAGGILLVYGIGAILGPILGSAAISVLGMWSLFVYTALVHAAMIFFVLVRILRRAPVPVEERGNFQPAPEAGAALPNVASLDLAEQPAAREDVDPSPFAEDEPHVAER